MENYEKGETKKVSEDCLPLALDDNTVAMKVNYGSKIRNLMGFAMKKIKVLWIVVHVCSVFPF